MRQMQAALAAGAWLSWIHGLILNVTLVARQAGRDWPVPFAV